MMREVGEMCKGRPLRTRSEGSRDGPQARFAAHLYIGRKRRDAAGTREHIELAAQPQFADAEGYMHMVAVVHERLQRGKHASKATRRQLAGRSAMKNNELDVDRLAVLERTLGLTALFAGIGLLDADARPLNWRADGGSDLKSACAASSLATTPRGVRTRHGRPHHRRRFPEPGKRLAICRSPSAGRRTQGSCRPTRCN
jgi:hypothetical protein